MIKVHGLPAFSDNYIWCIYDLEHRNAIVVDPGDFQATSNFLKEHKLSLNAILVTHHHPDHTAGINKLKQEYACNCIASNESKVSQVDSKLDGSETIELLGLTFTSIDVPGHTLDHNAYYCKELDALFCGDTLFSGGCGRLFEGTAAQMHHSLQRICELPEKTKIYCAHEYTLANLDFALSLMPSNQDLAEYIKQAKADREQGKATIPTTIAKEKKINPFLRSHDVELFQNIKEIYPETTNEVLEVFTATRKAKDNY